MFSWMQAAQTTIVGNIGITSAATLGITSMGSIGTTIIGSLGIRCMGSMVMIDEERDACSVATAPI